VIDLEHRADAGPHVVCVDNGSTRTWHRFPTMTDAELAADAARRHGYTALVATITASTIATDLADGAARHLGIGRARGGKKR
jgi:hypothetical protein